MARDFTVRPFEESDADDVLAVHEAAFRESGMEFVEGAPVDEKLRNVQASYLDVGGTFLVGAVDGSVVATGGYRPAGEKTAEIGHMRVLPECQRRGYGTRLLNELESRAVDDGFERIVLETHEDLVAAQTLYERRGYQVVERTAHPVTGDEMLHYARDV